MGTLADLERIRATWQAASLDAPLGFDVEGDESTLADVAAISREPSPEAQIETAERCQRLAGAIGRLDARSRRIIVERYSESLTRDEMGQRLGLSRSRVQQIESKALGKLRGMLT